MIFFAGFIMTYERPDILMETLQNVFNQTHPPQEILVVDNSETFDTQKAIAALSDARVTYYRVGYNSGPAGAAKIGLEILAKKGYDWIYWGDDDDPPKFEDDFEVLFNNLTAQDDVGCMGCVGHFFNRKKGEIDRVADEVLKNGNWLEVDNIAGGMIKIVNADVIRKGVLPDSDLFFGFEELDFDLKIRLAGYKNIVWLPKFYSYRKSANRIGFKRSLRTSGKPTLNRSYYSLRNLLKICWRFKLRRALLFLQLKTLLKLVMNYRYGFRYGSQLNIMQIRALTHFYLGSKGKL